jgi:myo-inositol 2-dehydrogenase/D-chiro-inositol 1-dehydrogenase
VFKEKPMGGSFVHPEFEAAGDADNTIALTRFVGGKGILKIGMTPASSRVECAKDFFERFSEAFLEETQEFVDCSIQGRKPSISARDGTKATEVGFAITESFRRGCEVHL